VVPASAVGLDPTLATIPVTLGGIATFVPRGEVRYAEATGDYARLVTRTTNHLVRIPIAELTERWADFGFVRVHRRWLVQLVAVAAVRVADGRLQLRVGDVWLDVSRRRGTEVRAELAKLNRAVLANGIRPTEGAG
jgi:DNA-binding LytR/AlgR family response regulator